MHRLQNTRRDARKTNGLTRLEKHSLTNTYRGRFAPTPSGPLHFGSLIAAVASYLDARSNAGTWLVRMEDLDPPREVAGAADDILRTLEQFGLHWDGAVMYQSQRSEAYLFALNQLSTLKLLYPCSCTRKEITTPYAGTCRNGVSKPGANTVTRIRVDNVQIEFLDHIQGLVREDLRETTGDFIVRRADKVFAYHLASIVDDADQGITDVIRGADLLDSTARQIYLRECLKLSRPNYAHHPMAMNPQGEKLSKQTHAAPLQPQDRMNLLCKVLEFLGQQSISAGDYETPEELLNQASSNWKRNRI